MNKPNYSSLHKFLHWLSAAVILWALISGFYVSAVDVSFEFKEWISFINVSITTVYLPIFILRVYVTFTYHRSSHGMSRTANDYLALGIHLLIHIVVAVVLVTGVLMMDRDISVFDIFFITQPLDSPQLIELFFRIHIWACVILTLLLALHVAAVVKHELVGNKVLSRMLFRGITKKESIN